VDERITVKPAHLLACLTLLVLGPAVPAACSKCAVDCADGFEPIPQSCLCRPTTDGGAGSGGSGGTGGGGAPLATCSPAAPCGASSSCIRGCPSDGAVIGVCSVPGRDTCGCGGILDPCDAPGTTCLMPACCDNPGICVTPAERAEICARAEGAAFDCRADAGA
jgi:hypothetical protein